ncbi:MinD/ParA family ATP-binding protein [Terrabacter terrigena]|uniref:MinD-like ATPase involved in chromosome partitioning or flagellar assembly n=1 Tax=Terrabacter terrigena TaxID=574718 RepID=A0ABW3MWI6_9MICO
MSKDETGSNEGQGIPGFSANNSIPGGFTLPIPTATAGEPHEDVAPADPWSSTWEDTSWQSGDTGQQPTVGTSDGAGSNQWTDSYEYGGEHASANGSTDSDGRDHNGSSTTSWTDWECSDPGTGDWPAAGSSGPASDANPSTSHWSTLQHNADTAAASEEEYSGWAPAGSVSPSDSGATSARESHYGTDHSAAQQAYAARPAVDPDVAAAVAEGYTTDDTAYDLTPAARQGNSDRPSAEDLITARSKGERQKVKANSGLRKAFGLGPSSKELLERDRIDRIARPLNGRKTIMVINTKGGGGKTLVTLMLASYLGRYRSGSVLAWDNNETEGTLGMRAPSQSHHRTVVDLLGALPTIANDPNAGTSELEHWVREQRGLSFDVLASADDDEAMRIIGEQEFEDLHTQLSRFYRMIVVDTGNNRLSPNWLAAAARADMLVFATSLKDDTSVVAAKNLDALVAMGRGDLVRNAVCVISHTSAKGNDIGAGVHTREHFEQWVRAVVDIPYDQMLAPGLHLDPLKISKKTHDACMEMAAVVVDGL